jgi:hypothetical protein
VSGCPIPSLLMSKTPVTIRNSLIDQIIFSSRQERKVYHTDIHIKKNQPIFNPVVQFISRPIE